MTRFRRMNRSHLTECQASAETAVNHQPNLCRGSAEPRLSGISVGLIHRFAGEEGFEPSDGGSKVRCLTTWRLPSGMSILPGDRRDDRNRQVVEPDPAATD